MKDHRVKHNVADRTLCGACHAWDADPKFDPTDFCTICGRTQEQIREEHGFVYLEDLKTPEEGPGLEAERLRHKAKEKANGKAPGV